MSKQISLSELQQELQAESNPREAAQLLAIADQLMTLAKPGRSASAHKAGWHRVKDQIAADHQPRWNLRWQFALTPALLVITLVSSVGYAQTALPGDALYSVKTQSENVQLAVTFSPAKKANLCSKQMKRRANELATLATTQISDQTVRQLTTAILQEATEFNSYANRSSDHTRLNAQRQNDASYVIKTLTPALQTVHSPAQAKAIQSTITAMHSIANQA